MLRATRVVDTYRSQIEWSKIIRLGRKSGYGWYQYSVSGEKQIDPQTEELIIAESKRAGISRVGYPQNEIRERLLSAMINEAADILQEGIAQSASDVDLVTVFGYGFPRWRGGLLHYADSIGIKQVLSKLEELQKEDPAGVETESGLASMRNQR